MSIKHKKQDEFFSGNLQKIYAINRLKRKESPSAFVLIFDFAVIYLFDFSGILTFPGFVAVIAGNEKSVAGVVYSRITVAFIAVVLYANIIVPSLSRMNEPSPLRWFHSLVVIIKTSLPIFFILQALLPFVFDIIF